VPSTSPTGDDTLSTAESGQRALAVALDATPLLGHPTGVGVFCAGALEGLAALRGIRVAAFAVSWRRRRGIDDLVPQGVSTDQRAMPARPLHFAWSHLQTPGIEWFVGEQDVVHGTNFVVPPTRRAARVATVHDLTTVRFPELCDRPTLAYPTLIRRALGSGAFIHTPSQFVAQEVIETFRADPDRVRAVPSGVPAVLEIRDDDAVRIVSRVVPSRTDRYVLSVGTAEPRKDLPGLVAAFNAIAAAHPELALVLAGPDGWGAGPLEAAISTSPFLSRIVRTGWVSDPELAALLRKADVLAFPSVYEGFGFPPLQAMSVGVPVVATCTGALPEVLGDGAALVPVGDAVALAGALAAVLDDEVYRGDLIARGRARADQFTWARCASGLAELYRDALVAR